MEVWNFDSTRTIKYRRFCLFLQKKKILVLNGMFSSNSKRSARTLHIFIKQQVKAVHRQRADLIFYFQFEPNFRNRLVHVRWRILAIISGNYSIIDCGFSDQLHSNQGTTDDEDLQWFFHKQNDWYAAKMCAKSTEMRLRALSETKYVLGPYSYFDDDEEKQFCLNPSPPSSHTLVCQFLVKFFARPSFQSETLSRKCVLSSRPPPTHTHVH